MHSCFCTVGMIGCHERLDSTIYHAKSRTSLFHRKLYDGWDVWANRGLLLSCLSLSREVGASFGAPSGWAMREVPCAPFLVWPVMTPSPIKCATRARLQAIGTHPFMLLCRFPIGLPGERRAARSSNHPIMFYFGELLDAEARLNVFRWMKNRQHLSIETVAPSIAFYL